MKRLVVIVMLIMCAAAASAQRWSVTPEAGMNVTTYQGETPKIGFKAGAAVTYTFGEGLFSIQSGLYYVQRGAGDSYSGVAYGKMKDENGAWQDASVEFYSSGFIGYYNNGDNMYGSFDGNFGSNNPAAFPREMMIEGMSITKYKRRKDYLQLPVMARFNWNVGKDVRLHVAAGPYMAIGLGGKTQYERLDIKGYSDYNITQSTENPFDGNRSLRRFDWGATLNAGIEVKKIAFNIGYDLGLGKTYKHDDIEPKYHTASFTVGYTF